jgi:pimeloyl-ACP methyl ester carboxylesterase
VTNTSQRLRGPGWWIVRLVGAVLVGLALALAIDVVRLGGVERWFAAHRLPPPYLPIGQTLEVDGAAVYLDCRGAGSPTVVLDSGLGTGAAGWGFVLLDSAELTRTCTWDRPGIGGSAAIGRHTAAEAMARLRRTLQVAGEPGPFVIVGHSLGGVYARIFAATHRAEVVGAVLVDPFVPDVRPIDEVDIEPALRARYDEDLAATYRLIESTEDLDWAATEADLAGATLGDLPVELLFVEQRYRWEGPYDPYEAELIAAWERLVLDLSSGARLTIAVNSTHMIQWDKPALVVDAIRRLVEAARGDRGDRRSAAVRTRTGTIVRGRPGPTRHPDSTAERRSSNDHAGRRPTRHPPRREPPDARHARARRGLAAADHGGPGAGRRARAGLDAEHGTAGRPDAGADSRADTGAYAGADSRADTGADARADSRADA